MSFDKLLQSRRETIVAKWLDAVIATYPAYSENFLKNQKNRFQNPVGYTIEQSVNQLFNVLNSSLQPDDISNCLDDILHIRSVQDFSPAEAVGFIFLLKKTVREELATEISSGSLFEELLTFESKVDKLTLYAFDTYMKFRELMYEIKAGSAGRRVHTLLRSANLLSEVTPPIEADGEGGDRRSKMTAGDGS